MSNREKYDEWCQTQVNLPIFFQPFWLEQVAVCGTWEVALSLAGSGQIQGVLPYYVTRKKGIPMVTMPLLTPYLGIWTSFSPSSNHHKNVSTYRKIIRDLLHQLPQVAYCHFFNLPKISYLLPAQWQGFRQSTRYTFQLNPPIDLKGCRAQLKRDVRNKIRKAEATLSMRSSEDIELLYQLVQKSFQYRGDKLPFTLEFLQGIHQSLEKRSAGQMFIATLNGEIHAAIYLVFDQTRVYNLLLGADPAYHSSGAVQLLLWRGIAYAREKGLGFDFEGSMIPEIHRIFAGFGAPLVPYYELSKSRNSLFQLAVNARRKRI